MPSTTSANPPPSEAVVARPADAFQWPGQAAISAAWLADENRHVERLLDMIRIPRPLSDRIDALAASLVTRVRAASDEQDMVDEFMQQYDLSSEEGVLLMCLAEALLRIPDADTADALIADKLANADWQSHLGRSDSLFVNASTWGLMLTGRIVRMPLATEKNFLSGLKSLVARSGEPVIRQALRQAMRIMGHQYVMGRTIEEALERAGNKDNRAYRHSFDMLGEAALTAADAQRYFEAYQAAIGKLGKHAANGGDLWAAPGISVKLSAIHPRYEFAQADQVLTEMTPRVLELAQQARAAGITMAIDAEEADRLALSLAVIERVLRDPSLAGWEGFGVVVQAYQKRAPDVIDYLASLAEEVGRRLPVRLVKGAYWDTEIKRAQEQGLDDYPVFTRKINTDTSYIACAGLLLARPECFYPQFATHNAHTVAAVALLAGDNRQFEFQRLHGMGELLYAEVIGADKLDVPCRVYAPVGSHEDLLPYLVRRLLENGANTSFVNRIVDASLPVAEIVADPVAQCRALDNKRHPHIPLPGELYGPLRRNSRGINLFDGQVVTALGRDMAQHPHGDWQAEPIIPGSHNEGEWRPVVNPALRTMQVGRWRPATEDQVKQALANAVAAQPAWDRVPVAERAAMLRKASDLLEADGPRLLNVLAREAGKTLDDGWSELREAVDFCRYYAAQAEADGPLVLPGPTGESNELTLHGRGVFACISPWNFPLAIFTGQVAAALVTGNTVIAKPAEQTNLIGYLATRALHQAGVPPEVLQFLPGDGATVGPPLTSDPRLSGVAFTGSTATAQAINRSLAARDAPLAAVIAETGGQNAMLVDSSALPEQLVRDVITSSFHTAGQRCSALRVLFVQSDVAKRVTDMLVGAMDELRVGDPALLQTDLGPVIDGGARKMLLEHVARMDREATLLGEARLPEWADEGWFVAPRAYRIESLQQLKREVFGPILHVVEYRAREFDQVIDAVNATGFGLTLGVHSRIESTVRRVRERARVGNCYVNRNMTGAVVGVQPFGGEGLSGTGPKAGGPHYLHRFCAERTFTVNTAAVGGNATLLAMQPETR